jgi:hypothetical protein
MTLSGRNKELNAQEEAVLFTPSSSPPAALFHCRADMSGVPSLALLSLSVNPFSSNVAHLTPGNWSILERSPHLWMVNVCRQS